MRLTLFIIYLLLCNKFNLGLFWYDWAIFSLLSIFTLLSFVVRDFKDLENLSDNKLKKARPRRKNS